MDRLFVPLATAPFQWFGDGRKLWELRAMRGQFTTKHVREGRRVELRRGYSTSDSLWGSITEIVESPGIRPFFGSVHWKEVFPESTDMDCAILAAYCILRVNATTPVIGFKVQLESRYCGSCHWNRPVLVGAPCVKCKCFSEWVEAVDVGTMGKMDGNKIMEEARRRIIRDFDGPPAGWTADRMKALEDAYADAIRAEQDAKAST